MQLLDSQRVDFEYDGEMAADVALNMELREAYPFCRLSGPANVLIMPAFHSASISTKMLMELGGATVIGPMLVGLDRSVQIVPLSANDAQLVNMAALAAYQCQRLNRICLRTLTLLRPPLSSQLIDSRCRNQCRLACAARADRARPNVWFMQYFAALAAGSVRARNPRSGQKLRPARGRSASISPCAPANSTRCSARTAPARRRRCA